MSLPWFGQQFFLIFFIHVQRLRGSIIVVDLRSKKIYYPRRFLPSKKCPSRVGHAIVIILRMSSKRTKVSL